MAQWYAHLLDMFILHFENGLHVFHAIFDKFVKVFVQFHTWKEVADFGVIILLGFSAGHLPTFRRLWRTLRCNRIRNVLRNLASGGWNLVADNARLLSLLSSGQRANKVLGLLVLPLTCFARGTPRSLTWRYSLQICLWSLPQNAWSFFNCSSLRVYIRDNGCGWQVWLLFFVLL